ncbi:YfhO family protein, partial [Patescibacteria group bacterium]|nr:YfhO family protein [Patescibacteria group bacterium]
WLEYGIHAYVASFLPLMLTAIEKKKFSLMSILIALQIYGGYPQYSIYSLILVTFYFLILHSNKNLKKILNFFIYIILGLALATPLLIPGLQLISRSIHSIDNTAQSSNSGFLPAENRFTAISPNFWGNPATNDYQAKGFYDNNAFYPGIFAIFAFFSLILSELALSMIEGPKDPKKSKLTKLFLFSIPIAFLLATSNPISIFLKNYFGLIFSKNGISTRIFLISNLAFSYSSAQLIENLLNKKKQTTLIFPISLILTWQILLLSLSKFKPSLLLSTVAFKNTLYGLLFSLPIIFSILLTNFFKNKGVKSFLLAIIIIISTAELFYLGWKYLPFTPAKYLFPTTPSIEFVQKNVNNDRIATLSTIPENMWMPYGLKSPDGYDATVPLLNYEYLLLTQELKFPHSASRARKITNINSPLFNSLSVKYLFHNKDYFFDVKEKNHSDFDTVFTEKKVEIIENKSSLSRARFTNNPIVVNSKNEMAKILTNQFDKNLVAFYSKNAPDNSKLENIKNCQPDISNILFISDKENSIELKTENNCPQILLLSDAYYPEWKAKIDQQSAQIYQANHAFRAVLVPPGTHTIKFYYFPKAFIIGLTIMLVSVCILLSKKTTPKTNNLANYSH